MRCKRSVIFLLVLGIGLLVAPAMALADDWNRATTAIFNEPVRIPGRVLPAGIYVFKVADIQGDRNIVQIWNTDETVLVATIMGWPEYPRQAPSKSQFVFEAREKGQPPTLKLWFHEGNPSGESFIYPKKKPAK